MEALQCKNRRKKKKKKRSGKLVLAHAYITGSFYAEAALWKIPTVCRLWKRQ